MFSVPRVVPSGNRRGVSEIWCQTAIWTCSPAYLGPICLLRADSEIREDDSAPLSLTLVRLQR